ncbi:MAG TPA: clostripain-related cysteine peptidase [Pyrinomonadaceae bacterium]|nr:clostripain-related cysteine peptidase [Pyrinomonadaceae bacterium]
MKARKKRPAWTIMVYLAGDNNLTTECMFALTEMKEAAYDEQEVNVVAQFDPSDPYLPAHRYVINRSKQGSLYADIIDSARYYKARREVNFRKESRNAQSLAETRRSARKSTSKTLAKATLTNNEATKIVTNDTDTGCPITLYNFISFCLQEYEADHYMVVLSGHAGGTERDYLLKDESSAGSLTFNELKQVFKRVKKDRKGKLIDVLGMDNCLMSMAEICYELRGLAEIVVGCESVSPASGWPYRQILERVDQQATKPRARKSLAVDAAKAIVEEYVNYYSSYWVAGLSVTQSALNLKKVDELNRSVNRLAAAMERELKREWKNSEGKRTPPKKRTFENSLLLAHWEAQSYNGEQFIDLYDFCDCLENRVNIPDIAKRCRELKKFIASEFVLTSCYCGPAYQYSHGVSLYFPWAQVAPSYWNLDIVRQSKDNGWGSFLQTYTRLTRRWPRGLATDGRVLDADGRMTTLNMASPTTLNESVIEHRIVNDRIVNDRIVNDRIVNDRLGSSGSRVHSMRNPPNMFLPDECIRDRYRVWEYQNVLRHGIARSKQGSLM